MRHFVFLVSLSLHQTGVTKEQKEHITVGCIGTSVPLRGRGAGDPGRPVVLIDKPLPFCYAVTVTANEI
jgi:hypothetical protein